MGGARLRWIDCGHGLTLGQELLDDPARDVPRGARHHHHRLCGTWVARQGAWGGHIITLRRPLHDALPLLLGGHSLTLSMLTAPASELAPPRPTRRAAKSSILLWSAWLWCGAVGKSEEACWGVMDRD